ncbi:MAG: hypothetical protein NT075_11615 [Chloroflexi bacterium]|nr:hypothetical protein [Chloroflexota bacterium]
MLLNTQTRLTAELVQARSIDQFATGRDILPAKIDVHAPFAWYGLDSLAVITPTGELVK